MKYIANIVTKNKIEISEFFNVIADLESADISLPTLIIGWDEVKRYFPEQDILEKQITPTISWTFSKREKRYQYEKDVSVFVERVIKQLDKIVNYHFFNYLLSTDKKKNDFYEYINKGGNSIYYNSRFVYIYNPINKTTLGVSLQDLKYIGIDIQIFLKEINKNNNNNIADSLKFITQSSFPLIKDNTKVLPYLNYLKNFDIYKETEK